MSLRLQKRLAASVKKCGKGRIWLDPQGVHRGGPGQGLIGGLAKGLIGGNCLGFLGVKI